MPEESKFSVIYHTSDYRGDHSADVEIALGIKGDTTISRLAEYIKDPKDYITIRRVIGHNEL